LNDNEEITLGNTSIREIPTSFAIQNNYPNPFNPTTTVKYQIPENTHVRLVVYNMLGQRVRTIVDQPREAGYYSVQWDGKNDYGVSITSGIYVYRIQAGSFVAARKMNLIK
jgi:flagellar hook assembly protein FlgD